MLTVLRKVKRNIKLHWKNILWANKVKTKIFHMSIHEIILTLTNLFFQLTIEL